MWTGAQSSDALVVSHFGGGEFSIMDLASHFRELSGSARAAREQQNS
jgi:hypothetical protein